MNIKQYKQFKFQFNDYSLLDIKLQYPISYIAKFFDDAFRHIYLFGTIEFIKKLKNFEQSGMSSEMISLDIDNENNLVYISEPYENSIQKITPEIDELIEAQATIELCHKDFIGYTTMTQENLFHLLLLWKEFVDKRASYILIYLDDKDWFDLMPFQTQEEMEQFIADHTKK
ncbi:MAG: hypothetical protein JO129_01285 [Candidatus Dependentiae bacterium]|nr:hypothetical protein [Candidatus Dependentiae bacterium]